MSQRSAAPSGKYIQRLTPTYIGIQSLDNPYIVKYLNWFIDNKLNELFIAVEWAEKGDLKLVMKRAQEDEVSFPEKQIWRYIFQIANALQHMHSKRIMHRDLKPANIFIDNDGDLKVGDLGPNWSQQAAELADF